MLVLIIQFSKLKFCQKINSYLFCLSQSLGSSLNVGCYLVFRRKSCWIVTIYQLNVYYVFIYKNDCIAVFFQSIKKNFYQSSLLLHCVLLTQQYISGISFFPINIQVTQIKLVTSPPSQEIIVIIICGYVVCGQFLVVQKFVCNISTSL